LEQALCDTWNQLWAKVGCFDAPSIMPKNDHVNSQFLCFVSLMHNSQLKWGNGMCRVAWTPEVRGKLDLLTTKYIVVIDGTFVPGQVASIMFGE
jgi:hypothetical protein